MLIVPHVEHLTRRLRRPSGQQQAFDDVADVQAVAFLRAVTEDRDRLVRKRAPDEDRQEALQVVAKTLPGPVHVGEPHRAGPDPVQLGVEPVQLLGCPLVDPVDVDG